MDHKIVADVLSKALDTLPRIKMADLYIHYCELGHNKEENIPLDKFRIEVSKWLSNNIISGFESRKGPTGGIYKKGSKTEAIKLSVNEIESNIESTETELTVSDGVFTIQIAPTLRIVQSDDRNWAIQKKSGETWLNKCYHGELTGMLKSAVKHIVNGEFKLSNSTAIQLNELQFMVKAMEDKLVAKLQEIVENEKK